MKKKIATLTLALALAAPGCRSFDVVVGGETISSVPVAEEKDNTGVFLAVLAVVLGVVGGVMIGQNR